MTFGFLPMSCATLRIAARSARSGTPVKSCSTTRATTNGISSVRVAVGLQFASRRTWSAVTFLPSQLRSTDSSTIRIDTGSRETLPTPAASRAGSEWCMPVPPASWKGRSVLKGSWLTSVLRAMEGAGALFPGARRSRAHVDFSPVWQQHVARLHAGGAGADPLGVDRRVARRLARQRRVVRRLDVDVVRGVAGEGRHPRGLHRRLAELAFAAAVP